MIIIVKYPITWISSLPLTNRCPNQYSATLIRKLSIKINTFASDDPSAILEVLKQESRGVIMEVDDWSECNSAVKCETYEPRQNYHVVIIYLYNLNFSSPYFWNKITTSSYHFVVTTDIKRSLITESFLRIWALVVWIFDFWSKICS